MALIEKIEVIEVERKLWSDRHAYVFSDTGVWKYSFEHRNGESWSSWKDDEDYIDNVRSDFLNEAGDDGSEIYDTELFYEVTGEELENVFEKVR